MDCVPLYTGARHHKLRFVDSQRTAVLSISELYPVVLWAMVVIAPCVFVLLFFISAPYGRYLRTGWGPAVSSRTGWLLMEAPASLLMLSVLLFIPVNFVVYLFLVVWQVHYFHRAFVYPFTLTSRRRIPITVVVMAIVFNSANAFLNGYHFVLYQDWYGQEWLTRWNFIAGSLLFALGYYITKRSDRILVGLRTDAADDYQIPRGFLYSYVSSPNYLGETVQWFGWSLMTFSPAAWVFLLWTIANLLPRAISHHQWYQEHFTDYPKNRKAFIPFVL